MESILRGMYDEGTCPRAVSSLMIPCVFRSNGSQLVHLWWQRSCQLSSSHNCRPSTVFSANVMEGCRTCEANQRACAGNLRPWTRHDSTHLKFPDIDLEAVLGEDRGDTLDEPLQRAQFLEIEKRNQIIHKLKVRHIDLCTHLHRVTTCKRQGQRVNAKLVQFCNTASVLRAGRCNAAAAQNPLQN